MDFGPEPGLAHFQMKKGIFCPLERRGKCRHFGTSIVLPPFPISPELRTAPPYTSALRCPGREECVLVQKIIALTYFLALLKGRIPQIAAETA